MKGASGTLPRYLPGGNEGLEDTIDGQADDELMSLPSKPLDAPLRC
jgi:hypothetical protein